MSLLEWAKKEIEIACKRERESASEGEWDYGSAYYDSALKAFESLLGDEHSGFSIRLTQRILNRLIDGKPLTPIEDTEDVWKYSFDRGDTGIKVYQCIHMSSLFKEVYPDGAVKYDDIDRVSAIDLESPDAEWSSRLTRDIVNEMFPIIIPYTADEKYKVYCRDLLTDRKNGDYDTKAVLFVTDSKGTTTQINRYFKEYNNGWIEIDESEYCQRMDMHLRREASEKWEREVQDLREDKEREMSKIKLFTHTDLDGVGCAVLAYIAFGPENVDVDFCSYTNINHKVKTFIEQEELFKSYDKVFITDISVDDKVAEMIDILDMKTQKVQLLDHHATALGLNKYPWCEVRIGETIKTSGTDMFYYYLIQHGYFGHINLPRQLNNLRRFVEIVRDYDTWRWKEELGEDGLVCKQLNDLFGIYGIIEFIEWAMSNIYDFDNVPYFIEKDRALLAQQQKDIDGYVKTKENQLSVMVDKFGYMFGVVFADRYISELGNRLSELHPNLDYIAMIDISRGTVSYRTVKDNIDLGGEIAHSFGGGGHRKAAGSTFNSDAITYLVLNQIMNGGSNSEDEE